MKVNFVYIALFGLALFLLPLLALRFDPVPSPSAPTQFHSPASSPAAVSLPPLPQAEGEKNPSPEPADDLYTDEELAEPLEEEEVLSGEASYASASFRILNLSSGRVEEVSLRDYVRGAVAAEMPASFHSEAMKAQAVAAHTYALRNRRMQQIAPDPALKGADFAADPSNLKGYMTEKSAKEFYGGGDNADLYWDKVCEAADSALDYVMEYEGEPIVAAYHAISAGVTEDAANVWIGEAPYLLPAESPGDLLAPGYESEVILPASEVRQTLLTAHPEMELGEDPAGWFTGIQRSDSGYITHLEVGGVALHGKEIRELFGLRSHNLEIKAEGGDIRFVVHGYGHGVGMSQYGADFLARQGYTFDEILENYYAGVVLRRIHLPES